MKTTFRQDLSRRSSSRNSGQTRDSIESLPQGSSWHSLETLKGPSDRDSGSAWGTDRFTPSQPEDPGQGLLSYPRQQSLEAAPKGQSIKVAENEWHVGPVETSCLISTGGCGAVKIFVDGENSNYCIVFHSFGDEEAKFAARQIGNYILRKKDNAQSLRVLCLQPYEISRDVMNSVYEISDATRKAGIPTEIRSVCLNNIEHERYSEFIHLDMGGSEQQILERYAGLVLKSRELSKQDRARKIELFQSLSAKHRTPEFLKKWSGLSLEEARALVEQLQEQDKSWSQRLFSQFFRKNSQVTVPG